MEEVRCQNCSAVFTLTARDREFYETMAVPEPTFCPPCRFQRRCSHINTRNLYPRIVDKGQPPMISMYSQDKNLNIVEDKYWHTDRYNFFEYGRAYDFQQSFFSQFKALWNVVPLPHLQRAYSSLENSDYCNAVADLKNCYLLINADYNESCSYGFSVEESKYCTDIACSNNCELCYEVIDLRNCYHCLFCDSCENCSGLMWCRDCIGCTDCFGCIGLRHKSYYIFNKPCSKEDYEKEVKKRGLTSWQSQCRVRDECEKFFLSQPHRCVHGSSNESTEGDYIYQSNDVKQSFFVKQAEHCTYGNFLDYAKNGTHYAYDYTMFGVGADHIYECAWCGLGVNNLKFCLWNYGASDLEYCIGCHYSKNLFGCIGLQHKQYCILNIQYTKQQYEELLPNIKAQMMEVPYVDAKGCVYRYGEFFPSELSPFDYNQTLAREFCPLRQEEARHLGFSWHDARERTVIHSRHWQDLPDDIAGVSDADVTSPILCKAFADDPTTALEHHCTQYFKITPQELAFYQRLGLAIPRYCHNSRHYHRLKHINPFRLWSRSCEKCGSAMQSTYAPDRPEIVYCEACYLKDVY